MNSIAELHAEADRIRQSSDALATSLSQIVRVGLDRLDTIGDHDRLENGIVKHMLGINSGRSSLATRP